MIPVEEALARLFALVRVQDVETVPLGLASGRMLAAPVTAKRDQPPFPASAMDGYAVGGDPEPGAVFSVVGEAAAGHRYHGTIAAGQAVRIFTGAPIPPGGTRVLIQEDVTRTGNTITLHANADSGPHIRPAGADFSAGHQMTAPRLLRPADIALLASMNVAQVPVRRRPVVAILATGDELVQPGEDPGPDQIIASNSYGLAAMVAGLGATPRILPIAGDTLPSLEQAFGLASDADLILTIGGASVGDHDLVGQAAQGLGLDRTFYKIAMRPGKPLMAGRMGSALMIGLPGNPVSAMVCGTIFVAPVLRAMLGLPAAATPRLKMRLVAPLPANGPREHYMRGTHDDDGVRAFDRQDSALLSVLAAATCLIVRPPSDGERAIGDRVEIIPI
jgi:molybdopterin molybdotransferase